ncbi:MAG: hypothetical protein WCJ29_00550 [bacterium]
MEHNIEVELRGLMAEEAFRALETRLKKEGVKCEEDDKDTYFFNVQKGTFKISDEKSRNQAKICLKVGDLETSALREVDLKIARTEVPAAIKLLVALGYEKYHLVPQKRANYFLPGAILSLKYTPDFQFHFEMESENLVDEKDIESEKAKLRKLCAEYGIVPMDPEEIAEHMKMIRKKIGFDA